jgi:hypothetical protein
MGFSYHPKARGVIAPFFHMSSQAMQQKLEALQLIGRKEPNLRPVAIVARP